MSITARMRLACLAAFALTLALLAVALVTAVQLSRVNDEVAASNAVLRGEARVDSELQKVRSIAGDRLREIGDKRPPNVAAWDAFERQVAATAALQDVRPAPPSLRRAMTAFAGSARDLRASAVASSPGFWPRLTVFRQHLYEVERERFANYHSLSDSFTATLARERALSERWTVALALAGAAIVAAIVILGLWMQRAIVGPIRRVAGALVDESATDIGREAARPDEIGALARAAAGFRRMAADRAAALRELEQAARRDALTGLPNRQAFDEALSGALAEASGGGEVALLCLDLDRFKDVNDTRGHAGGDALLCTVGVLLGEVCGRGEVAYRVGGDEFTVLQTGLTQPEAAQSLSRRLLKAFQLRAEGDSAIVGASIGVALFPQDAADETRLRHYADLALYRAKHDGRGRARFFSAERAGRSDVTGYVPMPSELAAAIAGGDLRLHYQPKMRARTNVIDGAEALVRWQHPARGLVAPNEFIPIAEKMGQIRALTEWTLERAVADQALLIEAGCGTPISVNISACLLGDPTFADRALKLVERRKGEMGFEITETGIIDDPENAMAHLRRFVDAGLRVSIDDYGSGMSSLAYLKQLPAHELKIDRAFIGDLSRSHRDPLIVRSTIDLAHALGLEVTAEGVEKLSAFALLRAMGCDLIQGFLVARPMPLDQLQAFLLDKTRAPVAETDLFEGRTAQMW